MLDQRENAVRSLLLDEMIRSPTPLGPDQIESACRRLSFAADEILRQLAKKGVIVRDRDNRLAAVYPVSAFPTRHRVYLADGRTFYAMCAIDAIGAAFTFDQDVTLESACLHCDSAVRVGLAGGRLQDAAPHTLHVLHADLRKYRNWALDC